MEFSSLCRNISNAQAEEMSNERPEHVYSKQYELMNAVPEGSDAEE